MTYKSIEERDRAANLLLKSIKKDSGKSKTKGSGQYIVDLTEAEKKSQSYGDYPVLKTKRKLVAKKMK